MNSKIENSKLHQKKGKDFRTFEILEDGLRTEYKYEGNYTKYDIEFHELEFKEIISSKKPDKFEVGLYFSVLFNLLSISYIFLVEFDTGLSSNAVTGITFGIIGATSAWASKIFTKIHLKHLQGVKTVSFYYRKNEQEIVDNFIKKIKEKKKEHFRNKHLKIDEHISIEQQKNTFLWMYESDQISKNEYEEMLRELENMRIIKGK